MHLEDLTREMESLRLRQREDYNQMMGIHARARDRIDSVESRVTAIEGEFVSTRGRLLTLEESSEQLSETVRQLSEGVRRWSENVRLLSASVQTMADRGHELTSAVRDLAVSYSDIEGSSRSYQETSLAMIDLLHGAVTAEIQLRDRQIEHLQARIEDLENPPAA